MTSPNRYLNELATLISEAPTPMNAAIVIAHKYMNPLLLRVKELEAKLEEQNDEIPDDFDER